MGKSKLRIENVELDEYEKGIEETLTSGAWTESPPEEVKRLQELAKSAPKEARVTFRVNADDLELLKVRALQEGMGYQTYLTSLIHKFVTEQFYPRSVLDQILEMLRAKTLKKKSALPKKKKKSPIEAKSRSARG